MGRGDVTNPAPRLSRMAYVQMFNDDIYVVLLLGYLLTDIQYNNPFPSRFPAPRDCLKIPALPKNILEERKL